MDNVFKYYDMIQDMWKDQTDREGTRYMQHIDLGIAWLFKNKASNAVINAWCIHPIAQDVKTLKANYDKLIGLDSEAILLTIEYRNQANQYSTRNMLEGYPKTSTLDGVKTMLKADKLTNYWHLVRNRPNHERAESLEEYFKTWLQALGVTDEEKREAFDLFDELVK